MMRKDTPGVNDCINTQRNTHKRCKRCIWWQMVSDERKFHLRNCGTGEAALAVVRRRSSSSTTYVTVSVRTHFTTTLPLFLKKLSARTSSRSHVTWQTLQTLQSLQNHCSS